MMADGSYDMTRPQLDPLSLRQFRRDALLQYSSTNQSEPLRILLFALLAAIFALAPLVASEVPSGLSIQLEGPAARAGCALAAVGSAALFARERGRRTAQIVKLEREYYLRDLPVTLDGNTGRRTVTLSLLAGSRAAVLILGSAAHVFAELDTARVLAARLGEAEVLVVGVPFGGGDAEEPVARALLAGLKPAPWLATAAGPKQWERFALEVLGLQSLELRADARPAERGAWIALTRRGRTCGSGLGRPPLEELLGSQYGPRSQLPPFEAWAEAATRMARAAPAAEPAASAPASDETLLLLAQQHLYAALASADGAALSRLWSTDSATSAALAGDMPPSVWLYEEGKVRAACAVQLAAGAKAGAVSARLDGWAAVLADGATRGLRSGGQSAVVLAGTFPGDSGPLEEALTTALEYPAPRASGPPPPTLLAVQRWRRSTGTEGEWLLVSHRTIPYNFRMGAMATLHCDCRGCVAFNRESPAR
ncbi:hypothetical protein T492DRAFT_1098272 [Pavlovales sp. CCMP2436]|nr:hypothetical protein T492DRAFT_1098272 [Pavlovales sp. CCMP2436]